MYVFINRMVDNLMFLLISRFRRRYSVERLRRLHQDLLSLILVDTTTVVTAKTAPNDSAVLEHHHDKNGHATATVTEGANKVNNNNNSQGRDLQTAAFLILAATRSADQQGNNTTTCKGGSGSGGNGGGGRHHFGVSMERDDASVAAFGQAQYLEQKVVSLIREIGLVLVHSLSSTSSTMTNTNNGSSSSNSNTRKSKNIASSCKVLRSDEIFEYFCQEGILGLFVQIVQEKPGMMLDRHHQHPARANRSSGGNDSNKTSKRSASLHGVTWSARVKAQVLSTISCLISAIRNDANDLSALLYILSQNFVNRLITCILPLHQWTDPALELMLPPYVDLLKNLVLQLGALPDLLFPFFIIHQNNSMNENDSNKEDKKDDNDHSSTSVVSFPLFAATLETGTSAYATQCDSYVHAVCLNLTVDLLQIPHASLQEFVVRHARSEQHQLARYLCRWLCQRTTRMVQLTTGPIVDAIRSNALTTQLTGLNDQMQVWNDVFGCCIAMRGGSLHVRLCECFLQYVARHLLCDLVQATPDEHGFFVSTSVSSSGRPFLQEVGVYDLDVVPNVESRAQVATVVLTRLFGGMAYPPLVRMLAVALFFPQSTSLWFVPKQQQQQQQQQQSRSGQSAMHHTESRNVDEDGMLHDVAVMELPSDSPNDHIREHHDGINGNDNTDEYILTPALNALVQGTNSSDGNASVSTRTTTTENLFRQELVKALRGDYGEWRTVSAAILVETLLRSPLLDLKTLDKLQILSPGKSNSNDDSSSSSNMTDLESAVATFLTDRQHTCKSDVSTVALECMSSLAMYMIYKSAVLLCTMNKQSQDKQLEEQQGKPGESDDDTATSNSSASRRNQLWKALQDTRSYFFRQTLESHQALGVSDIFVDLMEAAVQSRYKRVTTKTSWSRNNKNNSHQQQQEQQHQSGEMYAYLLSQHGCIVHGASSEVLIRKLRGVSFNDVEATRFYARMAVHFRAACRVVERFYQELDSYQSSAAAMRHHQQQNQLLSPSPMNIPTLDLFDEAEELAVIFGALRAKPAVGTEVDLHGRMVFPFSTSGVSSSTNSAAALPTQSSEGSSTSATSTTTSRIRTLSGDMIIRSSSRLVLVLDPTDMMIVKPTNQQRQQKSRTKQLLETITTERATVLCCIPLLNVIAAAVDGEWLHVAVRHDNVGSLIKNGNMAMLFDCSAGTSLIVRQYLDRCRQVLRRELTEKIKDLLSTTAATDDKNDDMTGEAKEKITVKQLPIFPPPNLDDSSKDAIQESKSW